MDTEFNGRNPKEEKQSVLQRVNKLLDFSLFTHRGFVLYLSRNVVMSFGLTTPLVFLSSYAKSQHNSSERTAFLLSILAFVDMVARPSMGLVANTKWIRPRVQYFFAASVIANGVCHLLAPLSSSYVGFCIYAGFFGFAFGWLSSVLFETLMDLVGPQKFSSAVGLVTIVECCPVLLGPPLLGIVCLPGHGSVNIKQAQEIGKGTGSRGQRASCHFCPVGAGTVRHSTVARGHS